MKHARRKLLKRKAKKTKRTTESESSYQGLNTPPQLPPHILDQIPAGTSLRPSLSSMRQIAAQKLATPFLPLPFNLTPQQQQVQNMRNNNDLKENAINQAKQDMINENERKRSLQKQEVDFKRENQLMKQALDNEKQEFEQKRKLSDEKHKLEHQLRDLKFQKSLMEGDKVIRAQKIKNEAQLALVEQAKYENQKLKETIEKNELNTKFKQYEEQYNDIVAQNAALSKTIEKMSSEKFSNDYNELIENISHAKAHNRILTTLKETQNKLIEERILNMTDPTEQQITEQFEQMKTDIEGKQLALVEQLKHKQNAKEQMDRLDNLRKYKQKLELTADDMENETAELIKLKESIGNIDDNVKGAINGKVSSEINRDIEREKLDVIRKSKAANLEQYIAEEKQKILNSQEYKNQRDHIAAMIVSNEQMKVRTQNWNEALKVKDENARAQMENDAKRTALLAKLEGKDPINALNEQFAEESEFSPVKSAAVYNQMTAQSQLASQELEQSAAIIQRFSDLTRSEATEGRKLNAFIDTKLPNGGDFIEYLQQQNNETIKDILSEYNQFKYVENN
jgi:hypothetical protein